MSLGLTSVPSLRGEGVLAASARRAPRIALVLPALGAGGSEGVVSFLANQWALRGWQVAIVTPEADGTAPYYALSPSVELRRLNVPVRRYGPMLGAAMTARRLHLLRRTFLELRPDLVVSFLTRTNVLSVLAARGTGIPVIVSERNNPEMQSFGPVWSRLRSWSYPKAYGLITMTQGAMDCFPREQRRRSWVIPNQVHLPPDIVPRRNGNTVAAVGRLVPQKGFDLLLEAFAQIADLHPDWKLVIWGEGPERERLTAQRDALGLAGRVHLPGVSERPGAWIETTDVFVLSSRYEGWGIVLMEAMAAGLPVVAFDCRFGPREMITHGEDGLLVPDGNIGALAASLSLLLRDHSLRRSLAAHARLSARRFSSENVMAAWDDVVDAALNARRL